jgi:hypothetical protein
LEVLSKKKRTLENQFGDVNSKLLNLKKYYRLLYADDRLLETTVYDALKLIGFTDLRNIRGKEFEDWIFNFKGQNHIVGVVEVKGLKHMVQKKDLAQCEGWVTDYTREGKNAKGVLILNQFKDHPFPQSRNMRVTIENRLENYARTREICVLPSCVLFDLVQQSLGGRKITREQIEKVILRTNGTLTIL